MVRVATLVLLSGALLTSLGCSEPADEAPPEAQAAPAAPAAPAVPPVEQTGPDPEVKIAELRGKLEASPDDAEIRRQLARALLEAHYLDEGIKLLEQIAEQEPDNPVYLLDLGNGYGLASRLPEAEAVYRRLLDKVPDHPIALHNLGNLAFRRDQIERSIELYQRAIAIKPDYLLARSHLGDALQRANRFREAYRAYESTMQLQPTTPGELDAWDNAWYQLAALDLKMGATKRAARYLEEFLRENPEHAKANWAYGQALLRLGRPAEAQRAFQRHMEIQARTEPTGPVAAGE